MSITTLTHIITSLQYAYFGILIWCKAHGYVQCSGNYQYGVETGFQEKIYLIKDKIHAFAFFATTGKGLVTIIKILSK